MRRLAVQKTPFRPHGCVAGNGLCLLVRGSKQEGQIELGHIVVVGDVLRNKIDEYPGRLEFVQQFASVVGSNTSKTRRVGYYQQTQIRLLLLERKYFSDVGSKSRDGASHAFEFEVLNDMQVLLDDDTVNRSRLDGHGGVGLRCAAASAKQD